MTVVTPVNPDQSYLNNQIMRKASADTNCHRVGKIVKFNKEELTCDVQLLELLPNPSGGALNYAIIPQLPLIIEGTDTSWLTWGNIVGSECLVHFNDKDIDNWFETGEEYLPNSTRLHNFSDGFVTLRPRNKLKVFPYDDQAVVLKNSDSMVRMTANTIQITNNNLNMLIQNGTVTITGNVVINGDVDVNGKITASGEITSGSIKLTQHKHGDVQTGSAKTGVPE